MLRKAAFALGIALVALSIAAVATGAAASGNQARSEITFGGWMPDGAARDTFWDMTWMDVPALSLTAVHCHGKVTYELQLGATGPSHMNPCYAAMGMYSEGARQLDTYLTLPGGQAVYRSSTDYGPWRYCVGPLLGSETDLTSGPPTPC